MIVLLPLAAPADAFFDPKDYFFPKPLIELGGRPIIERVVENLSTLADDVRFVFVVRDEDCKGFSLDRVVTLAAKGRAQVVRLAEPTAGALCSCLMAIDHIPEDEPLVIANGDQIFDIDLRAVIAGFEREGLDQAVITFDSLHPRWSYVRMDGERIVEAAEKRPISRDAIAGFYYFRRGGDFTSAAMAAMKSGASVGGRYFISATLNEAVLAGRGVGRAVAPNDRYHSFYSPQRLEQYERGLPPHPAAQPPGARPSPPLVVIPMAGQGSRFADAGYDKPKPFIDVAGRTMIETVMDNLKTPGADYLLLARGEHLAREPQTVAALKATGVVDFLTVDQLTEGAACTVLLARARIDGDRPILIANCDQVIDFDCRQFVEDCARRGLDGSILVFRDADRDPKWSFARTGDDGLVIEVAEKKPISDLATVGLYYFARGRDFVSAAVDMIARNERVNNEFYVCPVYNHAIAQGLKIGVFEIGADAMHGIGTPGDLDAYLKLAR